MIENPFRIALTTDTSFITAWSNDTEFESIFSRQIQGSASENDVLVGISTSGNSENIVAVIKQAKYKGLKTISFDWKTGGKMWIIRCDNLYSKLRIHKGFKKGI